MIKLGNPFAGWIDVQMGSKTFCASYLVDVWAELDDLFDLKDESYANKVTLDGESAGYLYLVAYLSNCDRTLNIVWQKNEDEPVVLRFNYEEFMICYSKEKERIGLDNYIRDFIMEERYDE